MENRLVSLDHGSGGEASRDLIEQVLLSRLDNAFLRPLDDSAVVPVSGGNLAVTTDSYVVDPIFFPGGNIGSLSIHGTLNDLSMQGARPLHLTLGLILEEGLSLKDLAKIVESIAEAAKGADVTVVAGDTKVVPRGHADRIFINTAGIGIIDEGVNVGSHNARPGDALLINGEIGEHGMAILTQREGLQLKTQLLSDSANLYPLVASILDRTPQVRVLRDPTRGGVATALNEIAVRSRIGIRILEKELPISPAVRAASEILGLDPLYVANEGKCLVFVPKEVAPDVLTVMRRHPLGEKAQIIGETTSEHPGRVLLATQVGGTRILSMLTGEQLPRIC
jgi:hydrogenase expression/formation protein HypE